MEKKNYDYALGVIRLIATVMVVVLHISQQSERVVPDLRVLTDTLNVSMTFFFCVSAQIYARREIDRPVKWFFHRYAELIVPSAIIGLAVIIPAAATGAISGSVTVDSVLSVFGFQVFVRDSWKFIQLWFLTDILICYAAVPFIAKIDFKKMSGVRFMLTTLLPAVLLQVLFSGVRLIVDIPLPAASTLSKFYLAYALFRRYDIRDRAVRRIMTVLTVLAVPAAALCAFVRYSGSFGAGGLAELLYLYVITLVGYVLYYWLYLLIDRLHPERLAKVIRVSDKLSYPVYLTHCHFIAYNTSLLWRFGKFYIGVAAALAATAVASVILYYVSLPVKKLVSGR